MSVKPADTGNLKNHTHKLNELTMYPHKALILDISGYTGSVLNIDPLPNRNGIDDYVVWVNGVTYEELYDSTSPDTIDLTNTSLGGLVDGITFTAANARDFLIWGLANNANNGFDGFAATHKPYSAYTGPAAIGLGATALNITGLTNAYQFTPGARIVIRNTVGTAPQYQWNWGVINSIVSSTSINVTMDNLPASYGVALTAATGGEILQWDKFRPWVVTASDQTLYTNNYRLIGELFTDTSGNINSPCRVDDPLRPLPITTIFTNTTNVISGVLATLSSGRYTPLWSIKLDIMIALTNNTANIVYEVRNNVSSSRHVIQVISRGPSSALRENATIKTGAFSTLTAWLTSTTTNISFKIFVDGYYVPGGMRE